MASELTPQLIAMHLLREQQGLTAYVYSVIHNYHLAEDVFQDVCVKAVAQPELFESTDHLLNWFRISARNRAIALVRSKEGRYTGLSSEMLAIIESEWQLQESRADAAGVDALVECLGRLPPRSRRVVAMRYFENRSGEAIAGYLGVKIESAYQTLSRIHKTLRDCVKQKLEVNVS